MKFEKVTFIRTKKYNIEEIDTNGILVSKKESNGTKNSFKFFIGYNGMMLLDHYL